MIYDVNGNVVCSQEDAVEYSDAQCLQAFMTYMASKCAMLGMDNTYYENPSGFTYNSYSVPQDEMKLGTVIAANSRACDIWATPSRSFEINGPNARTLSITSNANGEAPAYLTQNGYKFLGGKGGSLSGNGYHKAVLYAVEVEEQPVMLGVMVTGQTAYNNAKYVYKEICDMVKDQINGLTPTAGTNLTAALAAGGGYAVCIIPDNSELYQTQESPADLISRENSLSSAPTVQRIPASTTKAMTMLCALDYITDLHELITVKDTDITSGSGSAFYNGDSMTIYDALRIMIMESSNTLATTIARVIGNKILNQGE